MITALGPLACHELVEIERRRLPTAFTVDKRLAQSAQPHFAIFEQPQSSAHNVTGWPITARGNCLLDERAAVLVETERGLALVVDEGVVCS